MISARIVGLLKEYGWVVNLVFIALGGYFTAGAANAVVARAIRVVPTAGDMTPAPLLHPRRATSMAARADYSAMVERNLFDAKVEDLTPSSSDPTAASGQQTLVSGRNYDPNNLKRCSIAGTLRATLVANNPNWSMAVIYMNTSREPKVFSINEGHNQIADDAVLVDILSREVVVRRRDHFELCTCAGENKNLPPAGATMMSTPGSIGLDRGGSGAVTKVSATDYRIAGSYLDDTLTNLNRVATEARVVPSFRNGRSNGFKLFSIRPGSIYSRIGLQNGDVIQRVNGYEINSPDKALELYQKLRDATNVSIELMRRGQVMNFNYSIDR